MASTTTSEQRSIEPAIMASEIERLPDLEGFLKFASVPDWMRVALMPVTYPVVARPRRLDTVPRTPTTDGATPVAAAEPAPRPATPSRGVKSRTAIRKRTRPSKTEIAPSSGAMGETPGVRGTGPSPDDEHAKRVET
jgi:hypothetical protein